MAAQPRGSLGSQPEATLGDFHGERTSTTSRRDQGRKKYFVHGDSAGLFERLGTAEYPSADLLGPEAHGAVVVGYGPPSE